MELITWDERFLLGIPSLDNEHHILADLINALATEIIDAEFNIPYSQLAHRFNVLHDSMKAHFEHEEEMMESQGFPDLAEHHREHVMLLAELKSFFSHVESGQERIDATLLESLKTGFIVHTMVNDRQYAAVLRDAGTARPQEGSPRSPLSPFPGTGQTTPVTLSR